MNLMVTVPHSGEQIPDEVHWLKRLPALTLLTDVDRFVDQLYRPVCQGLAIPLVGTEIHRYVVDLNRFPTDIDATSVEGAPLSSQATQAEFVSGFHWTKTTLGESLLSQPISQELHALLTLKYHDPFHTQVAKVEAILSENGGPRYHLDLHSMPSVGKGAHKDSGQRRPDIVVSDCLGKSSSEIYKNLVIEAFSRQKFQVTYNWPYQGGRITERYGHPKENRHTLQIELNRALYMDEKTKEKSSHFENTAERLGIALREIHMLKI